jgi:hypothetical protein
LTDSERLELHAILKRLQRGNVVSLEDRRRTQRWMRIASVAAATFVLVGLGAVFVGTLNRPQSRSAFSTTAGGLGNDSSTEAMATTTTAAATTSAAAEGAFDTYRLLAGGDADAVRAEVDALLDQSVTYYTASPEQQTSQDQALCLEEVSDREVLEVAHSRLDGRPIVIFIVATEDGKEALIYDEATCVVVELPPE